MISVYPKRNEEFDIALAQPSPPQFLFSLLSLPVEMHRESWEEAREVPGKIFSGFKEKLDSEIHWYFERDTIHQVSLNADMMFVDPNSYDPRSN
jgi:hypothetical protein